MRFLVTFKTPDVATFEGLFDEATASVAEGLGRDPDPEDDGEMDRVNTLAHAMVDFAKRWVSYGELVTLEFDTEAGTCVAVRR